MPLLAARLTDANLLALAGNRAVQRGQGLSLRGQVRGIVREPESVSAIVKDKRNDFEVDLYLTGSNGLDFSCDCPVGLDDGFCQHCVALSLVYRSLPPLAPPSLPPVVDAACTAFDQVIDSRPDGDIFRNFATALGQKIDEVFDTFHALILSGHAAPIIELCEYAYRRLNTLDYLTESVQAIHRLWPRLRRLHLDACRHAQLPPIELAERLFRLELDPELSRFCDTPECYAELLTPAAFATLRRLAGPRRDPENAALPRLRISIAKASGDVDTLITLLEGDGYSSYARRLIVEQLQAAGRYDEALAWAETGLKASPSDDSLRQLAAVEYQRRGQHGPALQLIWAGFRDDPSPRRYAQLRAYAETAGEWTDWRDDALGFVRKKHNHNRTPLVALYLEEGNLPAAVREARSGYCTAEMWDILARRHEKEDPAQAIALHLELLESEILNIRYENDALPLARLTHLAAFMKSIGAGEAFTRELANLRAKYKTKRAFRTLIDRFENQ